MFKQLSSFYRFLIIILLVYGEVVGIYHTIAEHKEKNHLMVSIVIPPYAWYRSIEIWWHKDIDKELQMDMMSCAYFFEGGNTESLYRLNEELNQFSKEISKYSGTRIQILEDFSKLYIKYQIACANNIDNYLSTWNKSKIFKDNELVLNIEKEFVTFLTNEDISFLIKKKQELRKQVLEGLKDFNDGDYDYEKWKVDFDSSIETYLIFSKRTFKTLFDKEYNELNN
ncbi:MAG: hypothetical protein A2V93_05815 [Ignavibacteria bacterium RBG_16_34_14]|nr:MAG: hypothetical protein A2V93_05815 [Ignavibacteria bacterium RBG_16_34_14]